MVAIRYEHEEKVPQTRHSEGGREEDVTEYGRGRRGVAELGQFGIPVTSRAALHHVWRTRAIPQAVGLHVVGYLVGDERRLDTFIKVVQRSRILRFFPLFIRSFEITGHTGVWGDLELWGCLLPKVCYQVLVSFQATICSIDRSVSLNYFL